MQRLIQGIFLLHLLFRQDFSRNFQAENRRWESFLTNSGKRRFSLSYCKFSSPYCNFSACLTVYSVIPSARRYYTCFFTTVCRTACLLYRQEQKILCLFLNYRYPHFVLGILRVGIDIDFNIRRIAVLISGGWQPFRDNAALQFLY